jgi:F-type H+-transporting ATPase subunit delta
VASGMTTIMKITPKDYAQALYDAITQTNPKDSEKILDNFVRILSQNGDLAKYGEIEEAYKLIEMNAKGIKQAEITVAKEMEINRPIIDELNRIVSQNVGASFSSPKTSEAGGQGQPLHIQTKVDESIIGGLVMRVDDTLLDASVKGQLERLNKELKL